MSNLRALWNQIADEDRAGAAPNTRWRQILQEFVDLLNESYGDFLCASSSNGSAPDVLYVRIWPRGQRNSAFTILTVHATDKKARILGKDSLEFLEEDTFEKHLVKFKNSRTFKNSLQELKEIANQPVDGVLRVADSSWKAAVLPDIKIHVPPEEQFKLADASMAMPVREIELRVLQAPPTTFECGRYPSQVHPPRWLVAGGYVLPIDRHFTAEDRICVRGTPLPAAQLEKLG